MMLAFEPDLLVRQIADTADGNPVEHFPSSSVISDLQHWF